MYRENLGVLLEFSLFEKKEYILFKISCCDFHILDLKEFLSITEAEKMKKKTKNHEKKL